MRLSLLSFTLSLVLVLGQVLVLLGLGLVTGLGFQYPTP